MTLFSVEQTRAVTEQDLVAGFEGILVATDGLSPVGVFAEDEVGSDGVSVMAWEWPVRHVGSLQGTPRTDREVTLRGVTVIDGRGGGEPQFSRYIDWFGFYAELGVVTISRPPVETRRGLPNVPHPVDRRPADSADGEDG